MSEQTICTQPADDNEKLWPIETPVRATQTSFRIVDSLRDLGGGGVTQLATELDLSKSAVHKHLTTLRELGYVRKEGTTYHVGHQFLALGAYARWNVPLYRVARPKLEELSGMSGGRVSLMIEERGMGIYLFKSGDSAGDVQPIGDRIPLVATASGRAILAHLPKSRIQDLVDEYGLLPGESFRDERELRQDLRRIRDRDLAFERHDESSDTTGVAVPIRTADGSPVGAIAVTGSTSTMSGKRLVEDITGLIASTAKEIEVEIVSE